MIRIDGPAPQNLDLSTQSRPTEARTGTFKGEMVRTTDLNSVLSDAKEEITMGLADKADSKRLEERKLQREDGVDLEKIEKINEYLEQMQGEKGRSELEEAAKRILQGRRDGPSPREEARGQPPRDPTDQFMVLNLALRKGESEGASPERLDAIRDAIAELEEDFGPQIRAGIAAATGARALGTDAPGSQHFRETYRDVVLGRGDLAGTFDLLVERHGLEDFPRVLPSLVKSLGEDLGSVRPSRDPERMQAILQDLYNLEVAMTVMEQARALSETVSKAGRV